ncbi:12029_t:CDS:2 [Acaulospora morrowiae]|uniref:12029_t:CDS:1 n=1 Tax=Acaulospora morrowiae TaxID=94023 RepID=A0A9N8W8S6_9GLOM|nr:12029_t:CDS:2 [Acaulospora morrowiae]
MGKLTSTLCIVLAFCLITHLKSSEGTSLTYNIAAHERACFYAWADKPGEKIAFYFAVQSGGSFDIDYVVTDPRGKEILSGDRERQGDFVFTANYVGEYSFCFANDMSTFAEKLVDFDITIENEPRAELPPSKGITPEQTSNMEESRMRLSSGLSTIARTQKYFRTRENRNFSTVKSTENRIFWFALLESTMIVGMAVVSIMGESPFARFRGSKKLYVTDFASLAWCEQQYDYSLTLGRKVTTEMKAGSAIHLDLELEEHDIDEVSIETEEDAWGLKLYNLLFGLEALTTTGKTRELPIFGFIFDIFVFGIIDQVKKSSNSENDEWEWIICDTKTRSRPIRPEKSTISLYVKYQIMLYKKLFDNLANGIIDEERIYQNFNLNADKPFSKNLSELINGHFVENRRKKNREKYSRQQPTLRTIMTMVKNHFKFFRKSSDTLEVNYRYQGDSSDLGSLNFDYDEEKLDKHLRRSTTYWRGLRDPEGVPIEEAWKCQVCEYVDDCVWRLKKVREIEQKRSIGT